MYRQFETSLGVGFNTLLQRLADPVSQNDQQAVQPGLAAMQQSKNQRRAETRASQLAGPTHVPPVAAPDRNTGKRFRCYYWPRCTEW